jgi:hypothetical protein
MNGGFSSARVMTLDAILFRFHDCTTKKRSGSLAKSAPRMFSEIERNYDPLMRLYYYGVLGATGE